MHELKKTRVAVLATNGVERSELTEPLEALREAGADARIISIPETAVLLRTWEDGEWRDDLEVDDSVQNVGADDFDALVLPGGVMNPDRLRRDADAVDFVRSFFEAGKPVAAICHAPWLLVEADVLEGRTITSFPSIRTDVENAGAKWVDQEVVVDEGLVTSRHPDDLPAFIEKMIEEFREGVHAGQTA